MQRLAALIPRPRLHLIRFHGVLAPNAKLRALVVAQTLPESGQGIEVASTPSSETGCATEPAHGRPSRISWARLLKRLFDIDMQRCPNCSARELKIIAAILERPLIERILTHLGLQAQPPPARRGTRAHAASRGLRPQPVVRPTKIETDVPLHRAGGGAVRHTAQATAQVSNTGVNPCKRSPHPIGWAADRPRGDR